MQTLDQADGGSCSSIEPTAFHHHPLTTVLLGVELFSRKAAPFFEWLEADDDDDDDDEGDGS